ncbi:RDD family protein [Aquimarina sp. ERC-38]|uniref:RDD family protein n=1 Tax=Aquimarina sp. ERC-38 TaxID=2949996 RepID=UPI002245A781|nr:RDD family protein [Aquimarina sp. ERC-38]UZO80339.1 RDD family protein [Aquimarina sp. ERC-38]
MANLAINTTQNVNLNYKTVSIGERALALLIDIVIFWLYFIVIDFVTGLVGEAFSDRWTVLGVQSLLMLPVFFYSLYMHLLFNGRTVGKMILKIKVVRADGLPPHWSHYMIRWMLRLVDIWLFFAAIGILSILFSDKHQRLGDAAAGTIVISTKQKTKISHTILEEVEDTYEPKFQNVTSLTDKDVRLIKETYRIARRSQDLKTLSLLRTRVEEVLHIKSELYDRQFLDTVLKDYNYFTQKM